MSEQSETLPDGWLTQSVRQLVTNGALESPVDGNHGEIHPKGSDFIDSGIPFIAASDIHNGKILFNTCKNISIEQANSLRKGRSIPGDVLLTHKATLGRTAIVGVLNQPYIMMTPQVTYYRVKNKNVINNQYLKYYFDSPYFQEHLGAHGDSGSTRAYVGITAQLELPVILPSPPEQKAIAAVLSSLDDKIDLLHRQNATLEAMAEALFRQWFVVEAKDEWEERPLLQYVKLVGGGTPKTSVKEYWGGSIPWLSGGDIAGSNKSFVLYSEKTISEEGLKNSSAKLLPKFATVLTARGTVGKFCLLGTPMACSQTNYGILPADGKCYFFTFLIVDHLIKELQMAAYGSVFDTITTQTFEEVKLALPNTDDILEFEGQVTSLFSKMFANQNQIRTLEKLRDTLLPKLMSGEVRVDF